MTKASSGSSFGELLREYRIAAGMSQEGLAERARMSAVTIGALERGLRKAPRRDTIELLANALAVDQERRAALEAAADGARARRRTPPGQPAGPAARLPYGSVPSNSLVGREEDVASTVARLGRYRVVTVTGPGGIGRCDLALEIARRVPSGPWEKVCFTDLTPLTDGAFIAGSIASAMHPPLSGR